MKNYEAEKLKKIIKAKEEAMVIQVAETDALRKELTKLKSSLLYSQTCPSTRVSIKEYIYVVSIVLPLPV